MSTIERTDWTAAWVAKKLVEKTLVRDAQVRLRNIVYIERENKSPCFIATTAATRLTAQLLDQIVQDDPEVEFVAVVDKEAIVDGDAFKWAAANDIAIGGFGELMSALSLRDIGDYRNKEIGFVERGLRQHRRVAEIIRLDDRRYTILRKGLPNMVALFLNEYELLADHVRRAKNRYGEFRYIVVTNPNGTITDAAAKVAVEIGCKIYKWAGFYKVLHKR